MSEQKQLPQVVQQRGQLMSPEDLLNAKNIADVFVESGMFEVSAKEAEKDMTPSKKQAIATVKIIAGQEMGLTPFAAMRGMHIVQGKPMPAYQTLAALVKRTPGYDYKVLESTNDIARIEFFRNGESLGISKFDVDDMVKANLGGGMHAKYGKNMKFARAMTNGVNMLCPEVTMGPVYTPADFGGAEDDNGNLIMIEDEPKKSEDKPAASRSRKAATQAQTPLAQSTPVATPAATTQSTGTKSISQTPAQTVSTPTGTLQGAGGNVETTSQQNEVETEVVVDEEDGPVGEDCLAQILQAGAQNGWTEDQAENWAMQYFTDNGINVQVETSEELVSQLSMKLVNGAIEFLLSNAPQ